MKRLLVLSAFLSGCASIVSGGIQSLSINSNPDGANVQITDSSGTTILSSKTPCTATLKRDSGYFQKASYKIKVSKEGYDSKEQTLEAGLNGWYWGNIVFGGLIGMLIVDPATGAMWSVPDDPINISLVQQPIPAAVLMVDPPKAVKPETPRNQTMSHPEVINVP